uniref:Thioredoxin domain-containing protein n=1 Tax=Panagrolaimus sp. JU765 TaxID=591449 RepID=A0AC34QPL5_9BILA
MRVPLTAISLVLLAIGASADKPDIASIYQNPLSNGFGDDIAWVKWEDAIETALEVNKPIFLLIHKTWCHACKALKKTMQQSNARKAFKKLSEYFVMVNAADDEEPFEEEYRPDGKYIPRLLFLDKNGDLISEIKNKKAEYKNYSYYYSSPADILNSMKDVLRHFEIEVPDMKKGDSLKPKKPEKKRSHSDGPEPPKKEKKEDEKPKTEEPKKQAEPEKPPKKEDKKSEL